MGFLITKIWQILKHFAGTLSWAQTSYFWRVIYHRGDFFHFCICVGTLEFPVEKVFSNSKFKNDEVLTSPRRETDISMMQNPAQLLDFTQFIYSIYIIQSHKNIWLWYNYIQIGHFVGNLESKRSKTLLEISSNFDIFG